MFPSELSVKEPENSHMFIRSWPCIDYNLQVHFPTFLLLDHTLWHGSLCLVTVIAIISELELKTSWLETLCIFELFLSQYNAFLKSELLLPFHNHVKASAAAAAFLNVPFDLKSCPRATPFFWQKGLLHLFRNHSKGFSLYFFGFPDFARCLQLQLTT